MGKKTKKTRWRALALNAGQQSDDEEPCRQQRSYSKFFCTSPTKDCSKTTTRSNSSASEQKTTFNEDEYTRITTPRQDVLFKKGYLNKPKTYQTQTSTGSTCTPDHQSADGTDMEYESQLVFSNGFIDQNGIYYINSFEPFPFVVYNAPICYPEYPRTKRYSTDSMTESISPHNEESGATTTASTQPSGDSSTPSSTTRSPPLPDELNAGSGEPRRQKKKRRRKISRSKSLASHDSTDSAVDLHEINHKKTYALKPDAEEFVPRNMRPETMSKPDIDIAKIVMKLEEAAKHQGKSAVPRTPPKTTNQWISVSNRKKRRNKVMEEHVEQQPEQEPDDLFESFDVNQLVDVVPPAPIQKQQPEPVVVVVADSVPEPKPAKKKKPKAVTETAEVRGKKRKTKKTSACGDDSYDFLLENAELDEKTNVELSRELDRLIQKGIYSHLEAKIRSLNLRDDAFFTECVAAGDAVTRQPDLGEDFARTIHLTASPNFSVSSESFLKASSPPPRCQIARAVAEWMTRAREHSPEVDLLKSPAELYDDEVALLWTGDSAVVSESVRDDSRERTSPKAICCSLM